MVGIGLSAFDYKAVVNRNNYFINFQKENDKSEIGADLTFYLENVSNSKEDMLKDKIYSFIDLKANWDDLQAKPIKPETISNAIALFESLSLNYIYHLDLEDIYCSNYGTILFDWEFEDDNVLSLEIGDESLGYFFEKDSKVVQRDDLLIDNSESLLNAVIDVQKDLSLFI